jgi:hypothetical protein
MDKVALIKLCVDAYKSPSISFSGGSITKDQAGEAIRQQFIELMGTDKPDQRTYRKHVPEIFEIVEVVLDQLITNGSITSSPFFDQFVEYRDTNLGDSTEFFVEDRTMLTISEIADGHLNLRRQKLDTGDSFTVKTKVYGAKVYGDFLRFITGRLDWAGLVRKIDEAMRKKMAEDIYTNFMGAAAYLPSEFKQTGTFTDAKISDLISKVRTANGYAPVVIAGTLNALKKMNAPFASQSFLVSQEMANQINQNGILNVYQGVPLLEIPQVFITNTFTFKLDDDQLFVLPANSKPIKVVREGQSIIEERKDGAMDMSMEHTFITRYGIATVFNVAYGSYDMS